jgi:hypothetical protein
MATSEQARGQKTESVQFWLCIAMVSLALHSGLIFTLQRWVKVVILQPEDAGPIAVELVDAPNAASPNVQKVEPEAIVAVPQKPEVKPQAKSEPEPEVVQKPDPKPESPIVPPVKSRAPVPKSDTPQNPKPPKPSSKKPIVDKPIVDKPIVDKPIVDKPIVDKPIVDKPIVDKPIGSDKPLVPPGKTKDQDLMVNVPMPKLLSTPGEIGGKGTARLRLKYPSTIPFPATFSLKSGDVIRAKVKFIVTGTDFQSPQIKDLSPKLSGREQDQLLDLMYGFLNQISVEKIEIDTDAVEKPDTEWETTIELRL